MALVVLDINPDKTELVMKVDEGKNVKTHSITYDKIERIQFGTGEKNFLFIKKNYETIEVVSRGREKVYVMRSDKTRGFENLKEVMRNFAERNKISVG